MSLEQSPLSRRDLLAWLGRAAAASWCLRCPGARTEDEDAGPPKLANLLALRNEAAKAIDQPGVILVRTGKGLAAFPRVCTHKHHELSVDEKEGSIFCSLHGSRFDLEGKPTNGPATRALKWLKTEVDAAGMVRVDAQKTVEAGTWAPLPEWAKPKATLKPNGP